MEKVRGANPLVKFRTVYVGSSQPPSSETYSGLLWVDTSNSNNPILKYWNGNQWKTLSTSDEVNLSISEAFSTLSLITQNLREDLGNLESFKLFVQKELNVINEFEEKLQRVQRELDYDYLNVLDVSSTLSLVLQSVREELEDLKNLKLTIQEKLKKVEEFEEKLRRMQSDLMALVASVCHITNVMLNNLDMLHRRYAT